MPAVWSSPPTTRRPGPTPCCCSGAPAPSPWSSCPTTRRPAARSRSSTGRTSAGWSPSAWSPRASTFPGSPSASTRPASRQRSTSPRRSGASSATGASARPRRSSCRASHRCSSSRPRWRPSATTSLIATCSRTIRSPRRMPCWPTPSAARTRPISTSGSSRRSRRRRSSTRCSSTEPSSVREPSRAQPTRTTSSACQDFSSPSRSRCCCANGSPSSCPQGASPSGRRPRLPRPHGLPRARSTPIDLPLHERMSALRRELNAAVAAHHHRTNKPHGMIHAELRRLCGGPAAAQATEAQLRERLDRVATLR